MSQAWDPQQYGRHARYVSDLGRAVVELLAPRPGERILDLGCGDGALTQELVGLGCTVVGVDASPAMVAAARARGLDVRLMDGHALNFSEEFDAVFSNAALHWMTRPDDVLRGVWRALRPGGRFVGELGGAGNVATLVGALRTALARRGIRFDAVNPWYFPSAQEYRRRLEGHGFLVTHIALLPRPTPLPAGLRPWLETFARGLLALLPDDQRGAFVDEVVDSCRPHLCDARGNWTADYVRLRFAARKP